MKDFEAELKNELRWYLDCVEGTLNRGALYWELSALDGRRRLVVVTHRVGRPADTPKTIADSLTAQMRDLLRRS